MSMKTFRAYLAELGTEKAFHHLPVDSQIGCDPWTVRWAEELNKAQRRISAQTPRVRIDPQLVTPTQYEVDTRAIDAIAKNWPEDDWKSKADDPIAIYRKAGTNYVIDGHHRLATALKLGKQPFGVIIPAL
jgi:hypothetical protein